MPEVTDERREPDLSASGYLTVRQAAKRLGTSIANIHQMVHREQLALAARLRGTVLFRVGEIERAKAQRSGKRKADQHHVGDARPRGRPMEL